VEYPAGKKLLPAVGMTFANTQVEVSFPTNVEEQFKKVKTHASEVEKVREEQAKQKTHQLRADQLQPYTNTDGARVVLSTNGNLYCGRYFGPAKLPGTDGHCGPTSGPQCTGCKSIQAHVQKLQQALQERQKLEHPTLLPVTVKNPHHPHDLKLYGMVYQGKYGCDVCKQPGAGTAYHCDGCGWDSHVHCSFNLPTTVKDYRHAHVLSLVPVANFKSYGCDVCKNPILDYVFDCRSCNWGAHMYCVAQ